MKKKAGRRINKYIALSMAIAIGIAPTIDILPGEVLTVYATEEKTDNLETWLNEQSDNCVIGDNDQRDAEEEINEESPIYAESKENDLDEISNNEFSKMEKSEDIGENDQEIVEEEEAWMNWCQEANTELAKLVNRRPVIAAIYNCDEFTMLSGPDYKNTPVISDEGSRLTIYAGGVVLVKEAVFNADGYTWMKVAVYYGDGEDAPLYEGYIPRNNLAISDERFLKWENKYQSFSYENSEGEKFYLTNKAPLAADDIDAFPESYKAPLRALKAKHPNWTFVPMNVGIDFQTAIYKELEGSRSLIYKTFPAYDKEGPYDDGNWFYASEDILKLYMDPRNALTESAIFQFEMLTYNETYHTKAALETFLNSTFMRSPAYAPGTSMTYSTIIHATGAYLGVSPFHLAARIKQEQGDGTSALISGTYPGYEGYYNYFNVGATGTTTKAVIESGLQYAKTHYVIGDNGQQIPWNSAYFSIFGGAEVIANRYILKGQHTLYLQKFNVNPSGSYAVYSHQYMQNISAPTTEASSMKKLYEGAGALDSPFVFVIPVYNNMPEVACPNPTYSNGIVFQMPAGYNTSSVIIDGVVCPVKYRNKYYVATAPAQGCKIMQAFAYDASGNYTGNYVWSLTNSGGVYTATAEESLKDLISYHGFSVRIDGSSGLRFKSGISSTVKTQLTSGGINGYKLKESGNLSMIADDRANQPMVYNGDKVAKSVAYGYNSKGKFTDAVLETVDGRQRFSTVLTGLPANKYKKNITFRGYCVLTKNGTDYVIYGPEMTSNIYDVANTYLKSGVYATNSTEYKYIQQIVNEAK